MLSLQMKKPLISVRNLRKHFPIKSGVLPKARGYTLAVDDLNFDIYEGETLGLVGESGCGKTTTGRCLLRLIEPTSGSVFFLNQNIMQMSKSQLRDFRKNMQFVFQDPFSSFNPRMTAGRIIAEPLLVHNLLSKNEIEDRVAQLMEEVGLDPAYSNRFPHEFSGGQRQRIGIARALALNPRFIVADEPVSALDVSVQAQVMNLFCDLQQKHDLTYLFISHDLSIVRFISDRLAVMYSGKIVEIGDVDSIFGNPRHPYTKTLLDAVPVPDPAIMKKRSLSRTKDHEKHERDEELKVDRKGCNYAPECTISKPECREMEQKLIKIPSEEGHLSACLRYDAL